MARDRGIVRERVSYNETTLFKVYLGLAAAGIKGQLAEDAVTQMQNQGILFRENIEEEKTDD